MSHWLRLHATDTAPVGARRNHPPCADQLSVTSIGDCGFVLLRDTDINRVGTLLRGGTASGIRAGWRVSARSMQQLRGFNQPYQLGYAPEQADRFEKPWQVRGGQGARGTRG